MSDTSNNIVEGLKAGSNILNKISDILGIVFYPQIEKRKAKADNEVKKINAQGDIDALKIRLTGLDALLGPEARKLKNFNSVVNKSIPLINNTAPVENIEDDWLANFFEKASMFSDDQVQEIWARILAEEVNKPGAFSRRTINELESFSKNDAEDFMKICSYVWEGVGKPFIAIFDIENPLFKNDNVYYDTLLNLSNIGTIRLNDSSSLSLRSIPDEIEPTYFNKSKRLKFQSEGYPQLPIGIVTFTKMGLELFQIVNAEMNVDYYNDTLVNWNKAGWL